MVLDDHESAPIVLEQRRQVVVVVLAFDIQHIGSVPRHSTADLGQSAVELAALNRLSDIAVAMAPFRCMNANGVDCRPQRLHGTRPGESQPARNTTNSSRQVCVQAYLDRFINVRWSAARVS